MLLYILSQSGLRGREVQKTGSRETSLTADPPGLGLVG